MHSMNLNVNGISAKSIWPEKTNKRMVFFVVPSTTFIADVTLDVITLKLTAGIQN